MTHEPRGGRLLKDGSRSVPHHVDFLVTTARPHCRGLGHNALRGTDEKGWPNQGWESRQLSELSSHYTAILLFIHSLGECFHSKLGAWEARDSAFKSYEPWEARDSAFKSYEPWDSTACRCTTCLIITHVGFLRAAARDCGRR
jgi:hypothetical protein